MLQKGVISVICYKVQVTIRGTVSRVTGQKPKEKGLRRALETISINKSPK